MPSEQRHQLIRQARDRPAPLTLVAASLVSAGAAIAGLDVWVAIAAAAAAVLSGAQVVRTEIVVPARTRATVRAAVPIRVVGASSQSIVSTAVQYKPGRWLTAVHAVPPDAWAAHLRLADDWAAASVIHRDDSADLAVLDCRDAHPWLARLTLEESDEGDTVRVIGRARGAERGAERYVRIALDYTLQSERDAGDLVVAGPNPQAGFRGRRHSTSRPAGRWGCLLYSTQVRRPRRTFPPRFRRCTSQAYEGSQSNAAKDVTGSPAWKWALSLSIAKRAWATPRTFLHAGVNQQPLAPTVSDWQAVHRHADQRRTMPATAQARAVNSNGASSTPRWRRYASCRAARWSSSSDLQNAPDGATPVGNGDHKSWKSA